MQTEYEATFININKEEVRKKLKQIGARLIKPEYLMKRKVFKLPKGNEIPGGWLRVRNEGDIITMSLKVVNAGKIEDQKETCLKVDNFNEAVNFLNEIGCEEKSYQETKRELWKLNNVEISVDEWPYLEPFVEVEGRSEEEVKIASAKLGFDYSKAFFCSVDVLYSNKYIIPEKEIDSLPLITFTMDNPFIK